MPKQTSVYKGKVKIAFKKGNKVISKSTHNSGLKDMGYLFAKAVTGNLNFTEDIPRYIDIGYIVPSTETDVNPGDSGIWMSVLNSPVNIGGRQYTYDNTEDNWLGVLTTTVYFSDINGGIIDNVKENLMLGEYSLRIRLCSYPNKGRRYFAELELEDGVSFLDKIRDTTSVIITWYTELLYDNTDTTESDGDVIGG